MRGRRTSISAAALWLLDGVLLAHNSRPATIMGEKLLQNMAETAPSET
jgi:hypothetical protein